MRKFLFAIIISAMMPAAAYANCGFTPFTPFGCKGQPVCICDQYGCRWVFIGC